MPTMTFRERFWREVTFCLMQMAIRSAKRTGDFCTTSVISPDRWVAVVSHNLGCAAAKIEEKIKEEPTASGNDDRPLLPQLRN